MQKTGLDIAGIDPQPGVLLRRRREAAGLTQRQLAELAGVSDAVVCRLERGSRAPRLDVLVRLFVALGLQLPLETAPLDDPVEAELEAELKRTIQERFDEAAELKFFDGFDIAAMEDALRGFRHVYCGLTAAGLLGAPVRQIECELMLLGGEETIDRFTVWLDDQWARRWNDDEQHYDGSLTLDPRESGVARWESRIGRIRATFVDAFPPITTVTLKGRQYEVVGMAHLDAEDPHAKRILERVRVRLASSA